jgi:hypothetical protein
MRAIRAAAATIAAGSFLIWLYCVLRIFLAFAPIYFDDLFIEGIPVTFLEISIGAFIVFLASMFSYLVLEEA